MPIGTEPVTEEPDDAVRIKLGADEPQIVERYSFHTSILQQPSIFSLSLSGGRGTAAILAQYPPGPMSRCALYIGQNRQFTGELDRNSANGTSSSSMIEMTGRDLMARLNDTDIAAEQSFNNVTYEDIFRAALTDVGQGGKIIEISNTANRKIRSGANVKVTREPVTAGEVKQTPGSSSFNTVVTAKLGETWLDFLTRHFSKLGLFPWCDANGNFVLSRPNTDQESLFHFYRKRGALQQANIKSHSFENDTTRRFSEVVIFARNTGKKHGFNHTNGGFVDQEMVNLGFNRRRVFRDHDVSSAEEAEYFARKKIAEINRASWKLTYTISGHSAPTLISHRDRVVVVPDMMARVDDDELGIHDDMYIEAVEYRAPPRESVITLMRVQDMVFAEFQAQAAAKIIAAKPKGPPKKRLELDILGLRTGTFGFIPEGSALDNQIEARRAAGGALPVPGSALERNPTSFTRGPSK